MGLMIGGIVGGILFLVAVCLSAFYVCRFRRNKKRMLFFDNLTPDPFPPSAVPSFLQSPSTRGYHDRGERGMSEVSTLNLKPKSVLSLEDDPFSSGSNQPTIRMGVASRLNTQIDDYANLDRLHGGRLAAGAGIGPRSVGVNNRQILDPNPFDDPIPDPAGPTSLSESESVKRVSGLSGLSETSSNGGPVKMGMAV
jgi:hypothetical protein